MAVTEGSTIQITPDSLNTSYAKYRKDLIQMPTRALDEVAKYMSRRLGVRGKETVGELNGDMQIGPYSLTRVDENGVTITGRTLETYLGSGVKPFEPNAVRESIYGSNVFQGDALKNQPIAKLVGAFLFAKVGESFFKTLFTAKRNLGVRIPQISTMASRLSRIRRSKTRVSLQRRATSSKLRPSQMSMLLMLWRHSTMLQTRSSRTPRHSCS